MRRALRVVLIAAVLLVCGCGKPAPRPDAATASAPVPEGSLFELTFPLTDAAGRERHLTEFRGKPFVATMIYTNCTAVCPRVTADLKRLDQALPAAVRERTNFVLFSLDPERDTPEALAGFARDHGLDPARWTLLAARPDDMRTIAAVLDVRFRPDAAGEIAHSAVFVVVDRNGIIRHRQQGTTDNITPLVTAVTEVK